jgi:hypothetical protein
VSVTSEDMASLWRTISSARISNRESVESSRRKIPPLRTSRGAWNPAMTDLGTPIAA